MEASHDRTTTENLSSATAIVTTITAAAAAGAAATTAPTAAPTSAELLERDSNDNDRCHTVQLIRYPHQVSGHVGLLAYPDENTICKPLNEREFQAYNSFPDELKEFIPRFCGMVKVYFEKRGEDILCFGLPADCATCKDEKGLPCYLRTEGTPKEMPFEKNKVCDNKKKSVESKPFHARVSEVNSFSRNSNTSFQERYKKCTKLEKFIKLECISKHYRFPCIIDLKMGTRGHSDFASQQKRERKEARINNSTSRTLGVRLCGMQVYSVCTEKYTFVDKYDGRRFTDNEFRNSLRDFLFNGLRHRNELIEPLISRLQKLREHLEKLEGFRFYCSSLLLMYDGHTEEEFDSNHPEVEVRMIDFANARLKEEESNHHIGPDHGYILGVTSLVDIFTELRQSINENGTI